MCVTPSDGRKEVRRVVMRQRRDRERASERERERGGALTRIDMYRLTGYGD